MKVEKDVWETFTGKEIRVHTRDGILIEGKVDETGEDFIGMTAANIRGGKYTAESQWVIIRKEAIDFCFAKACKLIFESES